MMDLSREVGLIQQEIDAIFERLEVATHKDEEIVAEYEVKFEELEA